MFFRIIEKQQLTFASFYLSPGSNSKAYTNNAAGWNIEDICTGELFCKMSDHIIVTHQEKAICFVITGVDETVKIMNI